MPPELVLLVCGLSMRCDGLIHAFSFIEHCCLGDLEGFYFSMTGLKSCFESYEATECKERNYFIVVRPPPTKSQIIIPFHDSSKHTVIRPSSTEVDRVFLRSWCENFPFPRCLPLHHHHRTPPPPLHPRCRLLMKSLCGVLGVFYNGRSQIKGWSSYVQGIKTNLSMLDAHPSMNGRDMVSMESTRLLPSVTFRNLPTQSATFKKAAAKTERWAMPTWCHMFNSTLTGNARVWFDDLLLESIDSYDDLKKPFLENYLQQKKYIKDPIELHNIKKRDGESTEDFVRRYKLEIRDVKGAQECMRIFGFVHGITNPELIKRLYDKIPKTVDEKRRVTTSFLRGEVAASNHERKKSFPPWKQQEDEGEGTKGPMIIEAEIGGHYIHCMYMDGRSASEILYEHCFNRLRPKIKNQLVPAITHLIGFSGEIIWPIGQIQLLVRIRDEEHSASAQMNFVVVRSPSLYNGIIRRPRVKKLQAVPSTAQGMLKLPVEGGVITLKSTRLVSLECALVSGPEETPQAPKPIVEERVKRNLDIFAWKPADMTGVPRHIAKHHLNVREGCSPVRQKKKGQAVDRNQAIQEKVRKLVEAGIMKEVHYHGWLSNPVMVKKHDGSWRMCIDFKDLNKACPKDGYPLPEIDWKMPFGLRNARATYQRLVDKAFHKQISRNLEVYVDDLVIKSRTEDEIVKDIVETFKTPREINMKLNPKKCTFGVEEGMFLGYKVNTKGLKLCPDKVDDVLSLPSPKCLKDVQKLNGKFASLNRFLAKSAEKSLPFLKL
uniref:Retrotransposon protein, putative, Ty3-gypsy subclass n=1 Tax=Tanacetum cinerariifolium TaxID=118510 RepID=A0A6L2LMW3_TANCI|nr:retrotransposon protein, putative, Ty3-gypsy subclass [Tanacetum cinerariifolium]